MTALDSDTHPVQNRSRGGGRVSRSITMRAYEVYSHVYAPQEALVTGGCRGGFGVGELIAFLYAYSFLKDEWKNRANAALRSMENMA